MQFYGTEGLRGSGLIAGFGCGLFIGFIDRKKITELIARLIL